MKTRIVNTAVLVLLGLFFFGSSFAHEKAQSKTSLRHGHWTAPPEAAGRSNPIPRTRDSINRGMELFQSYCAVCHGPRGKGDGPTAAGLKQKLPDLSIMGGHHSDGDLAWKIANGRGAMPAWKGSIEQNDIWHLVNFIKSLSGASQSQ